MICFPPALCTTLAFPEDRVEGAGHLQVPHVLPCGPASRKVPSHGALIAFPPSLLEPLRLVPVHRKYSAEPQGRPGRWWRARSLAMPRGDPAGGCHSHSSGGWSPLNAHGWRGRNMWHIGDTEAERKNVFFRGNSINEMSILAA